MPDSRASPSPGAVVLGPPTSRTPTFEFYDETGALHGPTSLTKYRSTLSIDFGRW